MKLKEKIKIYLSAYDHKLLDSSAQKMVNIVEEAGSEVAGPIPLPTQIKRYTVSKSPFVFKHSRDQFEMRVHRRLLEIPGSNPEIVASLSSFNLPAGVGIEIKQVS